MAKSGSKGGFSPEFMTPMSAQKPGKDPMPAVANITNVVPTDPMGVVPPGASGGSIGGSMKGGSKR